MSASHQGLIALLHRADQIATERFADALGDSDLTPRQVQVLSAIEVNEGASLSEIVNLTGVDRSTLADIVRRLQKRKLIERRRTEQDARAYSVKLTDAGRLALMRGKPALDRGARDLLGTIPSKQRADLMTLLGYVVALGERAAAQKHRI